MLTTYEQFREAVLKAASPEHKEDIEGIRYGIDIKNNYFQLVARDLTLEDVLRVLGRRDDLYHITGDGYFCFFNNVYGRYERLFRWTLGVPAHLQSDETLLEIIKILK